MKRYNLPYMPERVIEPAETATLSYDGLTTTLQKKLLKNAEFETGYNAVKIWTAAMLEADDEGQGYKSMVG
jgi:hypothetical protein